MGINVSEGYELVSGYVKYFIGKRGGFRILLSSGCKDIEDIISQVNLKFIKNGYYKKWDENKTSKKYYISLGVKRALIDMTRTFKEEESLDKPDKFGVRLMDKIRTRCSILDWEDNLNIESEWKMVMSKLPNTVEGIELKGKSPILGECKLTMRTVAYHLLLGYDVSEIADMFKNPYNEGKSVSQPTVYNIRNKIKAYLASI